LKLQLLILLCFFILVPQIASAEETNSDSLLLENFSVTIDSQVFKFIQPAVKENEEIFIPIRSFLSVFGAKLNWDQEKSETTILADGKEYLIDLDLTNLSVNLPNGSKVPIKIINSQAYIPLGFIQEILNFQFTWDEENNSLQAVRIPGTITVFNNLPEAPKFTVVETFTGTASWYGGKFHGRETNNGEIFDENALTAAHRTLPFNTYLRVTFLETNKSTIVRVNDRGPHVAGRILDLSKAAAEEIGLRPHGLGEVKVEVLADYSGQA